MSSRSKLLISAVLALVLVLGLGYVAWAGDGVTFKVLLLSGMYQYKIEAIQGGSVVQTRTTNTGGTATFNIEPGTYDFKASKGCASATMPGVMVDGKDITFNKVTRVTFEAKPSGKAIYQVKTKVKCAGSSTVVESGTTNTGGTWAVGLLNGSYDFDFSKGCAMQSLLGVAVSGGTQTVTVPATKVTVEAKPSGKAIYNVKTEVKCAGGTAVVESGSTNSGGTWSVGLLNGTYDFDFSKGCAAQSVNGVVLGGTDTTVTVPATKVTVEAKPSGKAIYNVKTNIECAGSGSIVEFGSTNTGGTWSVGLLNGSYDFNFSKGCASQSVAGVSLDGTDKTVTVPATKVTFEAKPCGKGMYGLKVKVKCPTVVESGSTNTSGTWSVGLLNGTYDVEYEYKGATKSEGPLTFGGGSVTHSVPYRWVSVILHNDGDPLNGYPYYVECSGVGNLYNGETIVTQKTTLRCRARTGSITGPWFNHDTCDDLRYEYATVTLDLYNGTTKLTDTSKYYLEISGIGNKGHGEIIHVPAGASVRWRARTGSICGPWYNQSWASGGKHEWAVEYATVHIVLWNDTDGDGVIDEDEKLANPPHYLEISGIGNVGTCDTIHVPVDANIRWRARTGSITGPWQNKSWDSGGLHEWEVEYATVHVVLYNDEDGDGIDEDDKLTDKGKYYLEISGIGNVGTCDTIHVPVGANIRWRARTGSITGPWQNKSWDSGGPHEWEVEYATVHIKIYNCDEILTDKSKYYLEISGIGNLGTYDTFHVPADASVRWRARAWCCSGPWQNVSWDPGDHEWRVSYCPVITCPADVTVECDEPTHPDDTGWATATGICDSAPVVSYSDTVAAGDCPQEKVITRTWVATDACGNSTSKDQTITVVDTKAPTWDQAMPGDVTVECDDVPVAPSAVSASDKCDTDVEVTYNEVRTNDTCPQSYSLTRTWTAIDDCENYIQHVQTITVQDTTPPEITCPADETLECPVGKADLVQATVNDNCDPSPTITNNAPTTFPLGTATVTWTATDACGNQSTCTQEITVQDTIPPIITTCASDRMLGAGAGCQASLPDLTGEVVATDDCDASLSVSQDPVVGTMLGLGVHTVTFTVTDDAGNSAGCQASITVEDNTPPTITCPADVTVSTDAGICYATGVVLGTPTVDDNCSGVGTPTNNAPAQFPKGDTTVTWSVQDAAGNTATCTQTVTVQDNENPTITCPADVTVSTDAGICYATGVDLGTPMVSDNCPGVGMPTNNAPAQFLKGDTTVTWSVQDAAGNTSTCTQKVTVEDNEKPTITCPADVTVSTDAGICYATGVVLGTPTVDDNCPGVGTPTNNAPSQFLKGDTTVTWSVQDAAGNTATCTQTVTVEDNEKPTITCPTDVTVSTDAGVCYATGVVLGTPTVDDNCSGVGTPTNNAPAQFLKGDTTVTWSVQDAAGNIAMCTQTVTVEDDENPTITCPADVTVECDESTHPDDTGWATATDNCDLAPVVTYSDTVAAGGCPQEKVITRTWVATDACGNSASKDQTITVMDSKAPTWDQAMPGDVTVECDDVPVAPSAVSASDNCDTDVAVTYNEVRTNGTCPQSYSLTRTWKAIDDCGNYIQHVQTIMVQDTTPPEITCPADVTLECPVGKADLVQVTANDNCDPDSTITSDAPTTFPLGTTTVIWTATDACGNQSTCTQEITVQDTIPPVITTCASDRMLGAGVDCQASLPDLTGEVVATDDCDASLSVSQDPVAGTMLGLGVHTVTFMMTDDAGNSDSCEASITVEDNTPPTITCPDDITQDNDLGQCSAVVTWATPTASDNCEVASVVCAPPSGSTFPVGESTVTCTATDVNGHTKECSFKVTVKDNEAPTITCPADLTVNTDAGICYATGVTLGTPAVDDNCSGVGTPTNNAPAHFLKGDTTVTWSVQDAAGNTATCTQKVTVEDNEKPTITCPADVTVSTDAGICYATEVDLGTPTVDDNCPGVGAPSNDAPAQFPKGDTMVTWSVQDAAGNTATCTQTVTVKDNENPMITCPADVTVNTDAGVCYATGVGLGTPTVDDNCPGVGAPSNDAPAQFPKGDTTVTWSVQDAAGNTAMCTQTVTVDDNENPMIMCPADVTVNTDAGVCYATGVDLGTPTVDDNCPGVGSPTNDAPTQFPKGDTTVTWSVQDAAGNTAMCTQVVTVEDNENPMITCPADVTVDADENCQATGVDLGTAVVGDNCDPDPAVTNDAPAVFPLGTTVVTWTASDASGNSSTCAQSVTVVDVTSPTVSITAPEDGGCYTSANLPALAYEASDVCDPDLDIVIEGWSEAEGTHTVTVTATDNAGNVGSDSITYTVDDTPPDVSISYPGDGMYLRETVDIEGTATDTNLVAVLLTIGGIEVATGPSYNWDTTAWNDGEYVITLTASDCAGNAASASVTVTVDNTSPVTPIVTGSESFGVGAGPGEPPILGLMGVSEDEARIQIWIKLPGASEFTYHGSTIADHCGRWQYAGTITAEGLHSIRVGAHDKAGNWSGWAESYDLTVSGTTPLEMVAFQEGDEGYSGTTDVTIDVWNANSNYGDTGGLMVRQADKRAALIRFDLSSIPSGVTTERAILALYVGWRTNGHPIELSAYELLRAWEENEATWNKALNGQAWYGAGASGVGTDRSGEAVDVKIIQRTEGWITLDITPLVVRWVDQGVNNYGLIIRGSETKPVEYGFWSSEWWKACRCPRLMITYSTFVLPPPTVTPTATPTPTPTATPTPIATLPPSVPTSLYLSLIMR